MASKEVKITIGSYFDSKGLKEANESLAKIARDVGKANEDMRQSTLRASAAMESYAAKADKACLAMGGGYKTLAEQLNELNTSQGQALGGISDCAESGVKSLGAVKDATALLNGDMSALAKIADKLFPSLSKLGVAGVAALGAIGLAAKSLFDLGCALRDLFATIWNWDALDKGIADSISGVHQLKEGAETFKKEMDESRKLSEELTKNFNEEVNALTKLTKAQNEFNRAQEMAVAKSKEERDLINAKYNQMNRGADEDAEGAMLERRGKDLAEEESRIRAEIRNAENTKNAARKKSSDLLPALKKAQAELDDAGSLIAAAFGSKNKQEHANFNSINDAITKANILADEQDAIIEEKKKALEEIKRQREVLKTDRDAFRLRQAAAVQTDVNQANEALEEVKEKAKESELKRQDEVIKKEITETKKAIEEIKRKKKEVEDDLHKTAMKNLREVIALEKQASEEKKDIAKSAESEFAKAFSWYRDPAKAAAGIGEEQSYRDDLDRLHKDASRYGGKWRIDELSALMAAGDSQGVSDTLAGWRKSKRFTPQIEALVRASAAEQTKTTAEDELRKIAANTAKLDKKLDELLTMKGGE